jgi:aminoglycoside 3-N-acetyltransferase
MVHCAFDMSHCFRGSIERLTDVFIDAVGPDGHLLMVSLPYRSSSFDYVRRAKAFDVRKTPSMMGMVSELFRRRPEVLRSLHPTHPVLVRGRRAGNFVDAHPACRPADRAARSTSLPAPTDRSSSSTSCSRPTFFHYLEHLVSRCRRSRCTPTKPLQAPVIDRDGQPRTGHVRVLA